MLRSACSMCFTYLCIYLFVFVCPPHLPKMQKILFRPLCFQELNLCNNYKSVLYVFSYV